MLLGLCSSEHHGGNLCKRFFLQKLRLISAIFKSLLCHQNDSGLVDATLILPRYAGATEASLISKASL